MIETACYRVGQFFRALAARVPEEDVEQALRILTPEARSLFRRQARPDQRHALAVYTTLRRAGHTDAHLLAAALLHDVGKAAAHLPAWQRAIIVLLERWAPRLLAYLSQGQPRGWRRPYVMHANHPQVGARWAQDAGCSPLTVALIRRHQERPVSGPAFTAEEHGWLAALQAADNLN